MIRTTKIGNVDGIPDTWIFEYYCNLQEKLHGQTVIIRSLFNNEERTPSMKIYYLDSKYMFNDFSSGKKGGSILLVAYLYNLDYFQAINKIRKDFNNKGSRPEIETIKKVDGFKVTSHKTRNWNEQDAKFWLQFNIGSSLLKKYNVVPLKEYNMVKTYEDKHDEITINGSYLYGYFTKSGDLHKIYRPFRKKKFIQVFSHLQGSEQITYQKPTLVITSSLKDTMAVESLNFPIEMVSPDSENTLLPKSVLSSYFLKYENIFTLFDNDQAGHDAMDKYHEQFGIPGIYLRMSKDPSDSIRDYGPKKVKQYLTPFIPKL